MNTTGFVPALKVVKSYQSWPLADTNLIKQLVNKNSSSRIMVCTDSNMAADYVASQIIKYANMFSRSNFMLRANSSLRNW